jgi:hypothetical protein
MTKRYREALDEVEVEDVGDVEDRVTGGVAGVDGVGGGRPTAFRWRGDRYRVTAVLGHWREDPGWWRRPSGEPIRIEQADLWRVEAQNGTPLSPLPGVYELVRRGEVWRLDRVWD